MRQTVHVACRKGHAESFDAEWPYDQRDWRCEVIDENGKVCGLPGRYWDGVSSGDTPFVAEIG